MPVNIYRVARDGLKNERVAWLCDNEWLLQPQIDALSAWLEQVGDTLPADDYVADVGFCWRRTASAGGPVLEPTAMRRMAELRMSLFLSEYPGFAEDDEQDTRNEKD